ncbi:MAG: hypothetical protein CME59_08945 [Halioglobus sp.]|nr:hypothetical protein [Halioglobus sp.]
MKLVNAFATPIAVKHYPKASEINDALHRIILSMSREAPSDDAGRAHVGGWYSRGGFLARKEPEVTQLQGFFSRSLRKYLAGVVSEEFAQAAKINLHTWVALTQAREYQPPHVHAKSHISGVYYVNVPDCPQPQGDLEFITPVGEQELDFFASISATSYKVRPRPGDLVLFPSYLRHYTHPFFEGADRSLVVFTATCY